VVDIDLDGNSDSDSDSGAGSQRIQGTRAASPSKPWKTSEKDASFLSARQSAQGPSTQASETHGGKTKKTGRIMGGKRSTLRAGTGTEIASAAADSTLDGADVQAEAEADATYCTDLTLDEGQDEHEDEDEDDEDGGKDADEVKYVGELNLVGARGHSQWHAVP